MAKTRITNGIISVAKYGSYKVKFVEMNHSVKVLADQVETRLTKGAFVKIATSSSFNCVAVETSWKEANALAEWLRGWLQQAAIGRLGAARVTIPAIGFDRVGMYEGDVPYGDAVRDIVRTFPMSFIGASDLTDLSSRDVYEISGMVSTEYHGAVQRDKALAYFYPGGTQLSGTNSGLDPDEVLYGSPNSSNPSSAVDREVTAAFTPSPWQRGRAE